MLSLRILSSFQAQVFDWRTLGSDAIIVPVWSRSFLHAEKQCDGAASDDRSPPTSSLEDVLVLGWTRAFILSL